MSLSRTSQAVAVTRAGFIRPHSVAGDPDAQRKLCAGMRSLTLTDLQASLEARTIFFDGQVAAAIATGVTQIVVLGAGYDDRALRFRTQGVTFHGQRALLARAGWRITGSADAADLGTGAEPGRSLLVTADPVGVSA